jgi:hypothetical protein
LSWKEFTSFKACWAEISFFEAHAFAGSYSTFEINGGGTFPKERVSVSARRHIESVFFRSVRWGWWVICASYRSGHLFGGTSEAR